MRKKYICVLLSLVLAFSILGPFDTAHAQGSLVRIRIGIAESPQASFSITGSFAIDGVGPCEPGAYTAVNDGSSLLLYNFAGEIRANVPNSQSILIVQQVAAPNPDHYFTVNNAKHGNCNYQGNLSIHVTAGNIDFINHVPLEVYLYGVVPSEMPNSWHLEALKSQAVTARTYALRRMTGTSIFDLVDTSSNQNYKGYNASHTRSIEAVNSTRGQVLKCQGALVDVYYGASNGGWTEIPQHRWTVSNRLPYHIIKHDPFDIAHPSTPQEMIEFPKTVDGSNPIRYWDRSGSTMVTGNAAKDNTASRFMRISALEAFRNLGYIANVTDDLEIVGFSGFTAHTHIGNHGVCNDYTGANPCPAFRLADVTMTALAWRYAPNSGVGGVALGDVNADGAINISDYTLVRLHILGLKPIPDHLQAAADVNRDGQINISDYTLIRLHILGLKLIEGTTADGLIREPATATFTIDMTQLTSSGSYPVFYRSLSLTTVEDTGGSFRLWRRRSGHGIGLSQFGAQQRANSGHSYADILYFYYPDTVIDNAY